LSYGNLDVIRIISGLTEAKVSQSTLETLRGLAENMILSEISGRVSNEEMDGSVDGSNTKFKILNPPLADSNYDKVIDANDISVYLWTDTEDESTKTSATVDTVYPSTGLVVLSTAPASTVEAVTADYRHYFTAIPDWELVDSATNYLTAFLAMVSIKGSAPAKYALGKLRVNDDMPGRTYASVMQDILDIIREGLVGRVGRAVFESRVGTLIETNGV